MLTPPEYGWTDFFLDGESVYSLGYITDVAMEWLDAAINGLMYDNPFVVKGFCEPGWMMCAVTKDTCRVYFEDAIDLPDIFSMTPDEVYAVDRLAFCRALHGDMAGHLAEWANWELYDEEGPEADERRAARESALRTRLETLETLIKAEETEEETDEGEA